MSRRLITRAADLLEDAAARTRNLAKWAYGEDDRDRDNAQRRRAEERKADLYARHARRLRIDKAARGRKPKAGLI